jgi:hypothetical protein
MEWSLTVQYEGCFIIFTGKLSRTVHFSCLKEYEEPEVVVTPTVGISDFPLETPLKYADPVDEFTARRNRERVDRAVMRLQQEREEQEWRALARNSNSDQEATLKIA